MSFNSIHKLNVSISHPFAIAITSSSMAWHFHDNAIKWKYIPRYWPFVWGIHRSPVDSPHTGQWQRALKFPLISAWTTGWANNPDAGELKCHRAHYDVTVMLSYYMTGCGRPMPWMRSERQTYHYQAKMTCFPWGCRMQCHPLYSVSCFISLA